MGTTEKTEKIKEFIFNKMTNGELNQDSMVQIIELCSMFLNLKTISQYAKDHNMSYNGVKKHRAKVELLGQKFIIDNLA